MGDCVELYCQLVMDTSRLMSMLVSRYVFYEPSKTSCAEDTLVDQLGLVEF